MVNAVGLIIGAILASVIAAIGFTVVGASLVPLDIGNSTTYFTGNGLTSPGIWGLLPILFPFMVVGVLLIGVYALFRGIE